MGNVRRFGGLRHRFGVSIIIVGVIARVWEGSIQIAGNFVALRALDAVRGAPELGANKFADVAPQTVDRGDEIAISCTRLVAVAVEVNQVANFKRCIGWKRLQRGFAFFAVWVVERAMLVLGLDHVEVGKRDLLVGKLVALEPHFAC